MNRFYVILSLLLLFNLTFSEVETDIPSLMDITNVENIVFAVAFYAIIGALFGASIVGIIYLIGTTFRIPKLTGWGKSNIGNLITSGIMVIVIIAILFSLGLVAGLVTESGTSSPITTFSDYEDVAKDSVDSMIRDTKYGIEDLVDSSYTLAKYTTYSRSTSYTALYVFTYFQSKAPNAGLAPLQTVLSRSVNWLARALVTLNVLKSLVIAVFEFGVTLLIIGIILRFIPFTIKIGNTLIAFSLGMLIAFPFTMIVGAQLFEAAAPAPPSPSIPDPGLPPAFGAVCNPAMGTIFGTTEYGFWLAICTPICAPQIPAGTFMECWRPGLKPFIEGGSCFKIVSEWYYYILAAWQLTYSSILSNYATLTDSEVNQITTTVYHNGLYPAISFFVFAVTLAIVAVIITIGIIRSISITIGGEMYFYGISKLI